MKERTFWRPESYPSASFVQHVLVIVGIVALTYVFWQIRDAFLLAFAAIVVAVLLIAAASPIKRWTSMSHRWAVITSAILILVLIGLMFWLVGSQVRGQVSELIGRLPQAISYFEQSVGLAPEGAAEGRAAGAQAGRTGQFGAGPAGVSEQGTSGPLSQVVQDLPIGNGLAGEIASYGRTVLKVLAGVILVAIAGAFLALNPDLYRRGLVKLFPPNRHRQVDETLGDCGNSLYFWLLGELLAMVIVGTLAGVGTWLIGLPAPLALGLFAGLTEFVPIVGPIIGAVPALLLALTEGGTTFLWTLLLFLAIQQLESNIIAPLVQRRMVTIPPVVFLLSVVAFGLLFGILGVIIASPITVVAYVAVKKLYVRETLEEDTYVPGERASGPL